MSSLQGSRRPAPSMGHSPKDQAPHDPSEEDLSTFLDHLDDDVPDPHTRPHQGLPALVLGAVGVVYGDIGTSPIYAFREAIRPVAGTSLAQADVLGLLSLLIWTLMLIVTFKYVLILLRADNRGEGGVLSLYTLARLAIGKRSLPVLALGIAGAALFVGDAVITPAISVLSAVEGAGLVLPSLTHWVIPVTLGILIALFAVQKHGTAAIAIGFGPITAVWFGVLAVTGISHIWANPVVLESFNSLWAASFVSNHLAITSVVLGAVFLAVTGAEALYADLGHFGRKPIVLAWVFLVFPALVLNYLGQGALVLADPSAIADPFFRLVPEAALPLLVVLATVATVIAAQAVITGAFSMVLAAVQLGLLPRMRISHTSANQSGQIYIASVNALLLIGVVWLVVVFKSSAALASAYGIAVTGTMLVTTTLAVIYAAHARLLPRWAIGALAAPILLIETAFMLSNLSKLFDGGYVPVLLAAAVGLVMASWWRGTQLIQAKNDKLAIGLGSFVQSMAKSSVERVAGTAFFLTPDRDIVPSALLHSLKHFRVLHEKVVLLTVETLRVPMASAEERVTITPLDGQFTALTLRYGFMETPNVVLGLAAARKAGLKFNTMTSTFFLGRRRPVVRPGFGLGQVMDKIFAIFSRLSADPTDYYHLPRDRVVELGYRVAV
ncbi:MAG: potassium transporter Kup [Pseudomonadota bacterium]